MKFNLSARIVDPRWKRIGGAEYFKKNAHGGGHQDEVRKRLGRYGIKKTGGGGEEAEERHQSTNEKRIRELAGTSNINYTAMRRRGGSSPSEDHRAMSEN